MNDFSGIVSGPHGDQGATVDTYASRRIEGAMLVALRHADTLSSEACTHHLEILEAVQHLKDRLGRAPRAKEVSTELGWTLAELHNSLDKVGVGALRYGSEDLQQIEEESAHERAQREGGKPLEKRREPVCLQRRKVAPHFPKSIELLDLHEQAIMEMIYDSQLGLATIAAVLGISVSRVSQLHASIVTKLRQPMRGW